VTVIDSEGHFAMESSSPRRSAQGPLPDLPLIREDLLVQILRREREGAPRAELLELRRQYEQLPGLRGQ